MGNLRPPFTEDTYFHLFNHGNGDDNLFREESDYFNFLDRYKRYVVPIADTYAYCLMPNHFHFLIKIKKKDDIRSFLELREEPKRRKTQLEKLEESFSGFISFRLANYFNSYSKSFNIRYIRKGSLFRENVKRIPVNSTAYLLDLVGYIHCNPIHHDFAKSIEDWEFSSYFEIISKAPTFVLREEVLEWFGGRKGFIAYHKDKNDGINGTDF